MVNSAVTSETARLPQSYQEMIDDKQNSVEEAKYNTAAAGAASGRDDAHVVFTRTRLDIEFAVLFSVATITACVLSQITRHWQFVVAPVGSLPVWLTLRLAIPRSGMRVRTMRSEPMLPWFGGVLAVVVLLAVADASLLGHGFLEPAAWYHWVVGSILMIAITAGAGVIKHNHRKG